MNARTKRSAEQPPRQSRVQTLPKGVKPKTRLEKKEATRQQLIAATVDAIAVGGFADLTLSKVSHRANVSRGLVNFHFESKEQLLVETLEFLTEEYLQHWKKAVEKAPQGASRKLLSLVRNDFHPKVCNRKKIAVWFAFRGEAKSRPTYIDVCKKADDEFTVVLESLVAEIVREGDYGLDSHMMATGIHSMIEGMWLECLMSPQDFNREEALRTTIIFMSKIFPKHYSEKDWEDVVIPKAADSP